MVTGKDLIDLGIKPSKLFKAALEYINNNNLNDKQIIEYMNSITPVHIEPHNTPMFYHVNIESGLGAEMDNFISVVSNMNEVMVAPTVMLGALMPDACPTGKGQIPVGGVVVARNAIHPAMHSADICCSVMTTDYGLTDPKTILDAAHKITHFGAGGRIEFSDLPESFLEKMKGNKFLNSEKAIHLAKSHMGTQGDGNHFLFVGVSKLTGHTMMVTHHGSRGLGAYLYKMGMEVAEKYRLELSPKTSPKNAWIPFDTKEGEAYWEALQIVREWTKMNHETIHNNTASTAWAEPIDNFWNEHNFVFKDGDLFYHAKGATPLNDKFVPDSKNGLRLIPLNMAQPVLIVKGETTTNNLGFAPHGAGRNMSRKEHKGTKEGQTILDIFQKETAGLDVRFFSGKIDISELPSAYKNADSVRAQMNKFGLGEVVDEILPYGCIMAGEQDEPFWKKK